MHGRSAPVAQACLSAAAAAAAVAYGAAWLGLGWVYDISVNGNTFQLDAAFPLGLLTAALMAAAAGNVAGGGGARNGTFALTLGGGAIFASYLWILLVWAPSGAAPGQLELLKDAGRVGFAILALGLPMALPASVRGVARGACFALGVLLAPVLLFPDHVELAGLNDVRSTLPMLLFFLQSGLALTGVSTFGVGRAWGKKRAEPEASWMRAHIVKGKAAKKAKAPRLVHEPLLHHASPPEGPRGPERPAAPSASAKRRPPAWWFQF